MRFLILAAVLAASCTTSVSTCPNPVHDACTAKAAEVAAELAKLAALRGVTPAEMTTEYVNACTEQVQSDINQTLADLEKIIDGGALGKDGSP